MNKIHCNIDDLAHSILTYIVAKLEGLDPEDDCPYSGVYTDMSISADGTEALIRFNMGDEDVFEVNLVRDLFKDTCIKVFTSEIFEDYFIHISLDMVDKLPKEMLEYI